MRPRDPKLIDALDALPARPFVANVWRVVAEGRDPCVCAASGGRWDNETFDVLYTSRERDGAIAEMYFHLLRGQPVFPSRMRYRLHELRVELKSTLDFSNPAQLAMLGVDPARYGQLSWEERKAEYPRSQDLAEVAHFLDHAGIIVPSARWTCRNLVIFCDRAGPAAVEAVADHGLIDWRAWSRDHADQLRF